MRGQYQALSQDPNSLSNLDQDLPNNMIHQVTCHDTRVPQYTCTDFSLLHLLGTVSAM